MVGSTNTMIMNKTEAQESDIATMDAARDTLKTSLNEIFGMSDNLVWLTNTNRSELRRIAFRHASQVLADHAEKTITD